MPTFLPILVAVMSVIGLIFMGFGSINNSRWNLEEFIIFSVVISYLALVLYYVRTTTASKDSYLGLVMERRRLEEKAKINKLKSDAK